jgi:hypothetical protein
MTLKTVMMTFRKAMNQTLTAQMEYQSPLVLPAAVQVVLPARPTRIVVVAAVVDAARAVVPAAEPIADLAKQPGRTSPRRPASFFEQP